jgi:hypothetical protein
MPRTEAPCGTYAAVARHRRRKEELDDSCRWINATYMELRRWEQSDAQRKKETAQVARRSKALTILGQRHPEELLQIMETLTILGLPRPDPEPPPRAPYGSILSTPKEHKP